MIDIDVKTDFKEIKFNAPDDAKFWKAVAIEGQKQIRERTESDGQDVTRKAFKPYQQKYREYRREKGRASKPNLSFTGKMLGGMRAIGKKGMGVIRLTGEQGFKAQMNEDMGREFFGLDNLQIKNIFKGVSSWIAKKNKLK